MPRRPRVPTTGDIIVDTGAVLTAKERELVKAKIDGLNNKQAGLRAGYSPSVAQANVSEILSQPLVQAHWRACLAEAGLTVMDRAKILADAAYNAQTMVVDKNGEEHFNRDHRTSVEAVRVAGQLDGSIGPRQVDGGAGTTVNITIDNRALPSTDAIDVTPES